MKYNSTKAFGDCEGPLGFPMSSAAATFVEQQLAALPSDIKEIGYKRIMKVTQDITFADNEHADISFVTTDSVDRDMEVLIPKGGDWSQFKQNPVVSWAHKYDQLPIGRALWLKMETRRSTTGWLAKTQYTSRPQDWPAGTPWFPDAVWHFVRSGDLRGKSIGFLPLEVRPPDEKEIRSRPEMAKVRRVISKWLALEYAVAPVQSNPDALVVATAKARQKGILIPDMLLDDLGMVVPSFLSLPSFVTAAPGGVGGGDDGVSVEQAWVDMEEIDHKELTSGKPYPHEHSARLKDPNQYDTCRRQNDKFGTGIHAIFCKKTQGSMELQAIRFAADKFTAAEAKKWCADHDYHPISFEAATGGVGSPPQPPDPTKIKVATLSEVVAEQLRSKFRIAECVRDEINAARGRV